jgi:hypothetical protein
MKSLRHNGFVKPSVSLGDVEHRTWLRCTGFEHRQPRRRQQFLRSCVVIVEHSAPDPWGDQIAKAVDENRLGEDPHKLLEEFNTIGLTSQAGGETNDFALRRTDGFDPRMGAMEHIEQLAT